MKIISCFSYKGGAGRSTLAINTIPFIADELGATAEKPLILVDMDIDSCGLTFLLNLGDSIDNDYNVQALLGEGGGIPNEDVPISQHNLFTHLCPVGDFFNHDKNAILCLPAAPGGSLGAQGGTYDGRIDFCKDFVAECRKAGCSGILFDSAVGDQLTARWSNKFASHIMCCVRPTKQFREGTKRFFDFFDKKIGDKNIIIIPNVVPVKELVLEDGGVERKYPAYAKEQMLVAFSENKDNDENNYMLDLIEGDVFGVPQIERFMWQEGVLENLAKDDLTEQEKVAIKQYKKIATLIGEN